MAAKKLAKYQLVAKKREEIAVASWRKMKRNE